MVLLSALGVVLFLFLRWDLLCFDGVNTGDELLADRCGLHPLCGFC